MAIGNPLGYARALTQRALAGAFVPEAGVRIAAARAQRNAADLQQQRQSAERRQRKGAAGEPRESAVAAAKRVECLARIRSLLAPRSLSPGLRA